MNLIRETEQINFENLPGNELIEYISFKEEFAEEAEQAFIIFRDRYQRDILRKAEIYCNKFKYSEVVAVEVATCAFARVWKYHSFDVKKAKSKNIDKAILSDPTYAPAYKAKAGYDIRYQQNALATQDLINYAKYADEDPYTQLEISKLFFTNEDYANSKMYLDKVFDKVDDPIKYKLRAYLLYADGDYTGAKNSMDSFLAKAEKSRVLASDQGLKGLIAAGLAKDEKDPVKKAALLTESQQKIAIAKAAKDETMKWDDELIKIKGGGGVNQASVDAGATSPEIEALKALVAKNPQDTNTLFKLANAYQEVKNWNGAILSWQKMSGLLPTWAPAYYSQGYAYQQAGNNELAIIAYEKYIDTLKPEEVETNKEVLSYAYFAVAYLSKDKNPAKAKDYVSKSVMLNPAYQDAVNLNNQLNQ